MSDSEKNIRDLPPLSGEWIQITTIIKDDDGDIRKQLESDYKIFNIVCKLIVVSIVILIIYIGAIFLFISEYDNPSSIEQVSPYIKELKNE